MVVFMTDRKIMKLALEALEIAEIDGNCCYEATELLRTRLAQPEQEPVAWMFQHDETGRMNYVSNDGIHNPAMFLKMNPRYALVCPLSTTPPKRKPLTDKQILADETLRYYFGQNGGAGPVSKQGRRVVDAIEAAHGITKENT
jgi:hypothetical protein